jgi:signal transduction histidine kinase/DNA-binding response OmpR family regulator
MAVTPSKPFFRGTSSKVIAAFLLACTGIALALSITYFSFYELMGKVDQLSEPNKKLRTLNELFRRITSVDQQQRTEMVKSYKTPSAKLLSKSKNLFLILDTLKTMDWQDTEQLDRIYTMQDILHNRDILLVNYLHIKYEEAKNKTFLLQLDSLSDVLSLHTVPFDTTIITTQNQKTITSYIPVPANEAKSERSFFKKLFKKKKGEIEEAQPAIKVEEEISFIADTIPLTKKDSAVYHVSQIIKTLNTSQRSHNREMMLRELEFINVNTALLNELLTVLHEVETEEVNLMRENNAGAGQLVNQSIQRMIIFLIVFFLAAAFLLFFILIDISKSNYYRNQLIQAKDEAEELSQVKQRFLSNMSHEIRTPLQSIIGYAEQLKSIDNSTALGAIQASGEHLLHIVNEVLDFSRIESGKLTLNNQSFRLRPCFEEVLSAIAIQAEQKGLELREEVDVRYNLVVSGDAFRLRQILYNILSNAVKFTHTGFVWLKTSTVETDDRVTCSIRIEDSGIGIPTEVQSRIFNQFEQGYDQRNHYGGTGLGLTIVKSLVDAQHGTIHLSSTINEGSVFTVELSFARSTQMELEQQIALAPVINTRAVNHLLVIDDDPLILNLCSLILEKHHIAHTTTQHPETVLHTPLADTISHVLVDIRMPTVSGVEVCKALRSQQKPSLTIIALTAHALPTEQTALLQQGFDAILPKPFREHDLLRVLGMVTQQPAQSAQHDIDFSVLDQMTFHDNTLQSSVLKQFTEETEVDLHAFNEALKTKNQSTLLTITHTLAGRIGQVGGLALSRKLKEVEQELTAQALNDSILQTLVLLEAEIKTFQVIVTDRIVALR